MCAKNFRLVHKYKINSSESPSAGMQLTLLKYLPFILFKKSINAEHVQYITLLYLLCVLGWV